MSEVTAMLGELAEVFGRDDRTETIHVPDVLADRYTGDPDALARRVGRARASFPALADTEIVVTRADPDDDRKGRAFPAGRVVALPANTEPTNVTIYHELGHIAIAVRAECGEDLPTTSEEFCAIWSMAKMPAGAVDERRVPYLTTPVVGKEMLPEICRQALRYREDHHDYVQQCNRWLNGRWHSRDERYRNGGDEA